MPSPDFHSDFGEPFTLFIAVGAGHSCPAFDNGGDLDRHFDRLIDRRGLTVDVEKR